MRFRNTLQIRLATMLVVAPITAMVLGFFWHTYILPTRLERQRKEILDSWRISNPDLLPNSTILVRATVEQTRIEGETVRSLLQIDHVYYGPIELTGGRFVIDAPMHRPQGSRSQPLVFPPPFLTEKGIWALAADRATLVPTHCRTLGIALPARYSVSRSFHQAEAIANAVERVSKADPQDRIKTLQALGETDAPHIACWAIRVVGRLGTSNSRSFLENLATRSERPVVVQIAVDEALLMLEGRSWHRATSAVSEGDWQHSDARARLFARLAGSPLSADDSARLLRRLNHVALHGHNIGLTVEDLNCVVRIATQNELLPLSVRTKFVSVLSYVPDSYVEHEPAVDTILYLIKNADERELRISAAGVLSKNSKWKINTHGKALREVLLTVEDDQLRQLLELSLSRDSN